jgi:hypothetical protein
MHLICIQKILIATALAWFSVNCAAQSASRDILFKDIQSIDLFIEIDADKECPIEKEAIKNSVSYVISNTPLKKIDPSASDVLYFSVLTSPAKNSTRLLGCTGVLIYEFWRYVDFKGVKNLVAVSSRHSLHIAGNASQLEQEIRNATENQTKAFIVRWSQQR